ncbi:MAG: phage tail tip lysozyme [Candidatus Saccharimonadaceae bacterium]
MPITAVSMKYLNTYHKMLSRFAAVFTVGMLVFFGWNLATGLAGAESQQGQLGRTLLTIHDGSQERGVITDASTLREALEKAGIKLDANDITEPALDDELVATQYQVNIYRARPVIVNDAGKSTKVMSPYRTAQQIAKQANIVLQPEDKTDFSYSSDVAMVGPVEVMNIDRASYVNFIFYGKPTPIYTHASTVGEMLADRNIAPGEDDTLSVTGNVTIISGMTVELWHNGKQTVTIEESIDFPIEKIQDANREIGYRELKTAGEKGLRNVTYEIDYRNGQELERKALNSVITKEPKKQVEVVGAKGRYTSPSENETISWDFLISQGYSRIQTAGIMGNLMQEHRFNTSGDGLAQWTGSRQARLRSMFPNNYDTIYAQLEYLAYELNGPYASVRDAIKASTSLEQAVRVFQDKFEKCGVCAYDRRVEYARDILASH